MANFMKKRITKTTTGIAVAAGKLCLFFITFAVLSACGGGGGDPSPGEPGGNNETPKGNEESVQLNAGSQGDVTVLHQHVHAKGTILAVWETYNGQTGSQLYAVVGDIVTRDWQAPHFLGSGAHNVAIAASDSGFAVAWYAYDTSRAGWRVSAALYQNDSWHDAVMLQSESIPGNISSFRGPYLASDGNGYAVVWKYDYNGADAGAVLANTYDGSNWSGATPIHAIDGATLYDISLVANDSGYVAAWVQRQHELLHSVYANFFSGVWLGAEAISGNFNSLRPQVASNGRDFAVVWTDNTRGDLDRLQVRRFNASEGWGTTAQLDDNVLNSTTHRIVSNGSGYMVTWVQKAVLGSTPSLHASFYNSETWQNDPLIVAYPYPEPSSYEIDSNGTGYAIVWSRNKRGYSDSFELLERIHDGETWTSQFATPISVMVNAELPSMASNGIGYGAARVENDSFTDRIYLSLFDGATWTPFPVSKEGTSDVGNVVLSAGQDRYSVLWTQAGDEGELDLWWRLY